ncbi:hypothetical protein BC826DRAFT_1110086 [Russula brevipes]|nr:hypothetical protein BC826DRAFT_1110086 [Russula brevipes]
MALRPTLRNVYFSEINERDGSAPGGQLNLVKGIINPYNKPIHTQVHTVFQDRLISALTVLEKHLANRLQHAFTTTVDASLRAKLPNILLRHFETILNRLNRTSIFGSAAFAEKAPQYTPPPKEKKEKAPAANAHRTRAAQSREETQERRGTC